MNPKGQPEPAERALLPWETDGSVKLMPRDGLRMLVNNVAVRGYLVAALAALAMIFLMLFNLGSDIGGILIVIVGLLGLLFQWRTAPGIVLTILTYFMVFPFGIPGESFENRWEIEEARFRVTDIVLVLSVVVYVIAQYRVYGLAHQALIFENSVRRKEDRPTRRPPSLIRPAEVAVMVGISVVMVIAGQVLWYVLNGFEVATTEEFPFKPSEPGRSLRRLEPTGGLPAGATRFVLLVGLFFFGSLIAHLIFGYWRLRMLGQAEGAMMVLDSGWIETKREHQRVALWHAWARERASPGRTRYTDSSSEAKP